MSQFEQERIIQIAGNGGLSIWALTNHNRILQWYNGRWNDRTPTLDELQRDEPQEDSRRRPLIR